MARKTQHNEITSPELLAQVNPKNRQLKKEFLNYMKSVQRSPQTIAAYENDLDIFMVWCLQNDDNKYFIDLKIRDFVNFQAYLLEENGNSPARVRRIKATLSSLSNMIELLYADEYPMFRNLVRKIESPPNVPVREKTVLSDEQIDTLLQKLTERQEYEKACYFALAAFSGRRKAELVQFKVSDFSDSHLVYGSLYRSDPIRCKGAGTIGKQLNCYVLKKQFQPYLDRWLKQREEKGIESNWLFPQPEDPQVHRDYKIGNSWAKTASNILGVDVYPHALRHRFVSSLRASGLPDEIIISLIGWSESGGSAMLAIYDDADVMDKFGDFFKDGDIVVGNNPTSLSEL